MLLKRIEIRNIRKIKQADIEFHGPGLQTIQGMNKSGKTTLAQAISLTLNGPKSYTEGMITIGQENAEVIAYTDDGLKIRTIISDTVKQEVSRMDGERYTKVTGGVREFINSIRSGLETPWSLKDMTDEQIINLLKNRYGITDQIAVIDTTIKQKETTRTEIGRDIKKIGDLVALTEVAHGDPIDSLKEQGKAMLKAIEDEHQLYRSFADDARSKCIITDMEDIKNYFDYLSKRKNILVEYLKTMPAYTQEAVDACEAQVSSWYETERLADAYDAYKVKLGEKTKLEEDYAARTEEIERLRGDRKIMLASMKLGIKGLEITDDNRLLNNGAVRGITDTNKVGNWSTAESVQVFFSIGAVFASEFKVLIVDNAESLDENTQAIISDWAAKSGFLVILLKVGQVPEELEDGIIYLKEGEVIVK